MPPHSEGDLGPDQADLPQPSLPPLLSQERCDYGVLTQTGLPVSPILSVGEIFPSSQPSNLTFTFPCWSPSGSPAALRALVPLLLSSQTNSLPLDRPADTHSSPPPSLCTCSALCLRISSCLRALEDSAAASPPPGSLLDPTSVRHLGRLGPLFLPLSEPSLLPSATGLHQSLRDIGTLSIRHISASSSHLSPQYQT